MEIFKLKYKKVKLCFELKTRFVSDSEAACLTRATRIACVRVTAFNLNLKLKMRENEDGGGGGETSFCVAIRESR